MFDLRRVPWLQNLGLKLVSLAGALLLYSTVHGVQEAQRTVVVDLLGIMPPSNANRVLTSQLPARARITLRGSKNVINDLHSDDLGGLQIDMRRGADTRIELTPSMVHVPAGVSVEQIDPPWLDLVWEERISRDVPVQVVAVGMPAKGYVVRGVPYADPSAVRVSGAKSEVEVLQQLHTEGFDVTGLAAGRHTRLLSVTRPPGQIELDLRSVQVVVDVVREIVERSYPKLKVAVLGNPRARTQPVEVDVHMACPPDVMRALRSEQIVPRVKVETTEKTGSVLLPVVVQVKQCQATVTPPEVVVRW